MGTCVCFSFIHICLLFIYNNYFDLMFNKTVIVMDDSTIFDQFKQHTIDWTSMKKLNIYLKFNLIVSYSLLITPKSILNVTPTD